MLIGTRDSQRFLLDRFDTCTYVHIERHEQAKEQKLGAERERERVTLTKSDVDHERS